MGFDHLFSCPLNQTMAETITREQARRAFESVGIRFLETPEDITRRRADVFKDKSALAYYRLHDRGRYKRKAEGLKYAERLLRREEEQRRREARQAYNQRYQEVYNQIKSGLLERAVRSSTEKLEPLEFQKLVKQELGQQKSYVARLREKEYSRIAQREQAGDLTRAEAERAKAEADLRLKVFKQSLTKASSEQLKATIEGLRAGDTRRIDPEVQAQYETRLLEELKKREEAISRSSADTVAFINRQFQQRQALGQRPDPSERFQTQAKSKTETEAFVSELAGRQPTGFRSFSATVSEPEKPTATQTTSRTPISQEQRQEILQEAGFSPQKQEEIGNYLLSGKFKFKQALVDTKTTLQNEKEVFKEFGKGFLTGAVFRTVANIVVKSPLGIKIASRVPYGGLVVSAGLGGAYTYSTSREFAETPTIKKGSFIVKELASLSGFLAGAGANVVDTKADYTNLAKTKTYGQGIGGRTEYKAVLTSPFYQNVKSTITNKFIPAVSQYTPYALATRRSVFRQLAESAKAYQEGLSVRQLETGRTEIRGGFAVSQSREFQAGIRSGQVPSPESLVKDIGTPPSISPRVDFSLKILYGLEKPVEVGTITRSLRFRLSEAGRSPQIQRTLSTIAPEGAESTLFRSDLSTVSNLPKNYGLLGLEKASTSPVSSKTGEPAIQTRLFYETIKTESGQTLSRPKFISQEQVQQSLIEKPLKVEKPTGRQASLTQYDRPEPFYDFYAGTFKPSRIQRFKEKVTEPLRKIAVEEEEIAVGTYGKIEGISGGRVPSRGSLRNFEAKDASTGYIERLGGRIGKEPTFIRDIKPPIILPFDRERKGEITGIGSGERIIDATDVQPDTKITTNVIIDTKTDSIVGTATSSDLTTVQITGQDSFYDENTPTRPTPKPRFVPPTGFGFGSRSRGLTTTPTTGLALPFFVRDFGIGSRAKPRKKAKKRQEKGVTPTTFAIFGGITGKTTKLGIKTGLGVRPIPEIKVRI